MQCKGGHDDKTSKCHGRKGHTHKGGQGLQAPPMHPSRKLREDVSHVYRTLMALFPGGDSKAHLYMLSLQRARSHIGLEPALLQAGSDHAVFSALLSAGSRSTRTLAPSTS